MMMYINAIVDINFSDIALFNFLLVSIILFFVLRVIRRFGPHLFRRRKHKDLFRVVFPVAEFFLWLFVLIKGVEYLLHKNVLVAIGILILLSGIALCLSWFALRDLIAGVVFKSSGRIKLNETVIIGDYSGKLIGFRLFSIELETNNGEIVYIPYSRIITEVNIKTKSAEMTGYHNFILTLEKKIPLNKIVELLKEEIYSLPWVIIDKEPKIFLKEETNDNFIIEISVYTIDQQYNFNTEKSLKDRAESIFANNI